MFLQLKSPYLSITELPSVTLPNFTVITGVNGAGKTHLLKAITTGNVIVDIATNPQQEVRYFDWANLVPSDTGPFDGNTFTQQKQQIYSRIEQHREQRHKDIIEAARERGVPIRHLISIQKLARLTSRELFDDLKDEEHSKEIVKWIKDMLDNQSHVVKNDFRGQTGTLQLLDSLREKTNIPIIAIDQRTFFDEMPASWGQANLFQQSFAQLFVAYQDLKIDNDLKQLRKNRGEHAAEPLTPEQFEEKYNIPPWEFVNQTLMGASLGFEIDHPEYGVRYQPYQPKLRKLSTGAEMQFNDLSSGEKVLMSFALCVYYAHDRRQIASYPRLLLLDEIDAPLHPSMSKMLIRTIMETLVERFGIHIVLTTHSPSTVAVAPDDAVFVMKTDSHGIHKVSKGQALNILTDGVPTLAISFDGRRQVFVESQSDSEIYERLYQTLKARIDSERSLVFIAVGRRRGDSDSPASDENSGCSQVKRIVNELVGAGNKSVLGLVDWDARNTASERVLVLAPGTRYAIENIIYDPLIIAALVAAQIPDRRSHLGIKVEEIADFQNLSVSRLQEIAEAVQTLILGGSEQLQESNRTEVNYLGGFQLRLRKEYLEMRGHDLEDKIRDAFPFLRRHGTNAGSLMKYVVETIIATTPRFIPSDVNDVLEHLLTMEITP